MKNIGLMRCTKSSEKTFTTDFGIRVRRLLNYPLRRILHLATKRKIIVEQYPVLKKGQPYIFASSHSFDEDIIANLSIIDRNAWVLIGTTNQLEYNKQMYAAWLNGMIYVDRLNDESRKNSVAKMKRILHSRSSVLMFPEGGWNNTENLLVQKLFAGPWILAKETGLLVVPVAAFNEHNSDTIYLRYDKPLALGLMEKECAIGALRDSIATMMFEMIEKHTTHLNRAELIGDLHMQYMEERRLEYMRVKWTRDVWEEELTVYQPRNIVLSSQVREFVDRVKLTAENAGILAPMLVEREQDVKYDFKAYMHHASKRYSHGAKE